MQKGTPWFVAGVVYWFFVDYKKTAIAEKTETRKYLDYALDKIEKLTNEKETLLQTRYDEIRRDQKERSEHYARMDSLARALSQALEKLT